MDFLLRLLSVSLVKQYDIKSFTGTSGGRKTVSGSCVLVRDYTKIFELGYYNKEEDPQSQKDVLQQ